MRNNLARLYHFSEKYFGFTIWNKCPKFKKFKKTLNKLVLMGFILAFWSHGGKLDKEGCTEVLPKACGHCSLSPGMLYLVMWCAAALKNFLSPPAQKILVILYTTYTILTWSTKYITITQNCWANMAQREYNWEKLNQTKGIHETKPPWLSFGSALLNCSGGR